MDGRKAARPARITIEPTQNGGHIVEHSFDNSGSGESYRMPEKHAFGNHAALMTHLRKHTAPAGANPEIETDPADKDKTPAGVGHPMREKRPTGAGRAMTGKAPGPRTYGAGVD